MRSILALAAAIALSSVGCAANWQATQVGDTKPNCTFEKQGDALTLSGEGKGINLRASDELYFASKPITGDVEIVARIAAFDGGKGSQVGIMLRKGAEADGPVASVVYRPAASNDDPPRGIIELRHREKGVRYSPAARGSSVLNQPPLWLKLVRIGQDYAVYKSTDGKMWSAVTCDGGGPFTPDGELQAGVFVSSPDKAATATFDNIYIGKPRLEFLTSWIGNDYNTGSKGFVSNNIASMYVSPDGTVYTNTFWDEAGEAGKMYKDGKVIGSFSGNNYCSEGTIAGDGKHIYFFARNEGIKMMDMQASRESFKLFKFTNSLFKKGGEATIRGLAVGNGELYVSDVAKNQILVASLETMTELPERAFPFERPGPIAVDGDGNLWIIQYPADNGQYVVKCYGKDGKFTGRQITDVAVPKDIRYDGLRNRLLIPDAGPDQNVKIYEKLDTTPACTATFGEKGGIWSGGTPGLIYNADAGGYCRFYNPNGAGVDAEGNFYVNCTGGGNDLRKYTPEGKLVWQLRGLHFVDCGDFDPATDGKDIYTPFKHYKMDYSKTAPGSEWSYYSFMWNGLKYKQQEGSISCMRAARVGDQNSLVLYTSGQGYATPAFIYRMDGEVAVPCGRVAQAGVGCEIWVDKNGDGIETKDEVTSGRRPADGWFVNYYIDSRGDIWSVWASQYDPNIRHFILQGVDERGTPIYSMEKGCYEDIKFPSPIGKGPGGAPRVAYDREADALYLYGQNEDKEDKDNLWLLARYDNWSKGNRKATYAIKMPTPDNNYNHMSFRPYGWNIEFTYQAFDIAGDYIFAAELWGPVHVFEKATGKQVVILNPGPEVSGLTAWEDANMGVRAFKRSNGEYIIIEENSGFRARENMYRWKPNN